MNFFLTLLLTGVVIFLMIVFLIGIGKWTGGEEKTVTTREGITRSADNTPKCSKCGSTSISADKKGFGVGKAAVGAVVAGPIGLAAGSIGSKKVRITCLNCGHQWMVGKN